MAGLPSLEEKLASPELQSFSQRLVGALLPGAAHARRNGTIYSRPTGRVARRCRSAVCRRRIRRGVQRDRRRAAVGESSLRSGAGARRCAAARADRRGSDSSGVGRSAAIADAWEPPPSSRRLDRRPRVERRRIRQLCRRPRRSAADAPNDRRWSSADDRRTLRRSRDAADADDRRRQSHATPTAAPQRRRRSPSARVQSTARRTRSIRLPNRSKKKNWCSTVSRRWRASLARGRRASKTAASRLLAAGAACARRDRPPRPSRAIARCEPNWTMHATSSREFDAAMIRLAVVNDRAGSRRRSRFAARHETSRSLAADRSPHIAASSRDDVATTRFS